MTFFVAALITAICMLAVVIAVVRTAIHYHRTKPSRRDVDAARTRLNAE